MKKWVDVQFFVTSWVSKIPLGSQKGLKKYPWVSNRSQKSCTLLHLSAPLQNLLNGDFFGISTSKSASYENRLASVVNTNLLIYRYVCDPHGVFQLSDNQ